MTENVCIRYIFTVLFSNLRPFSNLNIILYFPEKAILSVTAQGKGVHCVDLGESFPAYSSEYLIAKFVFDTAENEPPKGLYFGRQKFVS